MTSELLDTTTSRPSMADAADESAVAPKIDVEAAAPAVDPPWRFLPTEPSTLEEAGLNESDVDGLVLKALLYRGTSTGRTLAEHLRLPRRLIVDAMERLRAELLIAIKGSAGIEDFVYQLTEAGYDHGGRLTNQCTYAGAAPVSLEQYVEAVQRQALGRSRLGAEQLHETFRRLRLSEALLNQLGQALNEGRGLFLYGPPGNGKTSISEIIVSALGESIWIPYTITIDGELIRLYDPRSHKAVELPGAGQLPYDRRWILIERPTIVAGGELTMAQLDLQFNRQTGICEASMQMRANGGALVIDDFGRQRMPTAEMLNRLILPMESCRDYLNLASGRQVATPFDSLLVFSTNLEPRDLVDEAFLRRIPYKIEVDGPTSCEFAELFLQLAADTGCRCDEGIVQHLIETHYNPKQRPLRFCHPRDLLRQIRNYCQYNNEPVEATPDTLQIAVHNYFAGL